MRLKKNVRMTLLYLAFVVIGVVMVFPFILDDCYLFQNRNGHLFAELTSEKFTLDNYREVLAGSDFPRWFLNQLSGSGNYDPFDFGF